MIGLFLLYAALDSNSREAKGLQAHRGLFNISRMGLYCWASPLRGCSPSGFMAWRKRHSAASPRLLRTTPGSRADEERKRCSILQA
jgi:hypothetical protein